MKKHLLLIASLVLGFGQLFADNVDFKVSELKASLGTNTTITTPYTWKVASCPVTVTIAKKRWNSRVNRSKKPLSTYH